MSMPESESYAEKIARSAQPDMDETSLDIPAPIVNKFQLLFASGNLRIAFAEGFSGRPNHYRSAVVMSALDAVSLAQSILRSIPATPNLVNQMSLGTFLGGAPTDSPLPLRDAKNG
jgi:hypothetical protein